MLCDNHWKFWTFSILKFWNKFSEKCRSFSKNWSIFFQLKVLRLKTKHFHKKLPCQKPMLRQIERGVQNGPITENRVLPITSLFFWKNFSSLSTSCKGLIWCTNHPNVHIHSFQKHWSFIWTGFFPVTILKLNKKRLIKSILSVAMDGKKISGLIEKPID